MFSTAPEGRAAFRFTSFGDLATPNTDWVLSYGQAAYAVGAVEQFQPLFHLRNGDLCYADLNPAAQPHVWRAIGENNQPSAPNPPWMHGAADHDAELGECATGPARTWGSANRGCRCATGTRWTWCSAGTTTTTSGRSPFGGSTRRPGPRPPPARPWTPGGRTR